MGQAAVDLPDPKDAAPAGGGEVGANSADDLLAQLAGEEIDRLLAEDASPNTPEATSPPRVEPDTAAQIDAVLNAAQTPVASAPVVEAQGESLLEEKEEDLNTAAEMRQLLNDKSIGPAKPRMPIYVKALQLLNTPFDHAPDFVREMMGKVAILTLFNSVAVLLYVLIFRRHK